VEPNSGEHADETETAPDELEQLRNEIVSISDACRSIVVEYEGPPPIIASEDDWREATHLTLYLATSQHHFRAPEPNLAEPNLAEPNLAEPNLAESNLAESNLAESNRAEPDGHALTFAEAYSRALANLDDAVVPAIVLWSKRVVEHFGHEQFDDNSRCPPTDFRGEGILNATGESNLTSAGKVIIYWSAAYASSFEFGRPAAHDHNYWTWSRRSLLEVCGPVVRAAEDLPRCLQLAFERLQDVDPPPMTNAVKVTELAEMLGVAAPTLRAWIDDGVLTGERSMPPGRERGEMCRVRIDELGRFGLNVEDRVKLGMDRDAQVDEHSA
jgi:hypothetical protein